MKRKAVLIDFLHEGHHAVYSSVLLKGLRSAGFDVMFIGTTVLIEQITNIVGTKEDIKFVIVKSRALNSGVSNEINKLLFLKDALISIGQFKPDIVHFLQLDRFLFGITLIRLFLKNCRVVSTLHWCGLILHKSGTLKSFINSVLLRYLLCNSKIITHSRKTNEMFEDPYKNSLYYAPYPIHTEPIDHGIALMKKLSVRQELGITESEVLLLCFGGARYDKGLDLAIEALSYLNDSYRLLIAGKEEDFTQDILMKQAERLGVSNRILFKMDFIEEEKMLDIFCASDYVLTPYSTIFSGQSGPLIYAASLGVPVIGSSAPIIRETIEDYQLGEVFMEYNASSLASYIRNCVQGFRNPIQFNADHNPDIFCNHVIKAYSID